MSTETPLRNGYCSSIWLAEAQSLCSGGRAGAGRGQGGGAHPVAGGHRRWREL